VKAKWNNVQGGATTDEMTYTIIFY